MVYVHVCVRIKVYRHSRRGLVIYSIYLEQCVHQGKQVIVEDVNRRPVFNLLS